MPNTAPYYWIIDKDHIKDADKPAGTNANAVGLTGPRNAVDTPPTTWGKHQFKMYDDDNNLYYEGYLYFDPKFEDREPEVWFFPLEDFGEPNAGCTSIHYKNKEGVFKPM